MTGTWFRPIGDYDNGGEPMDDALFDELMTALDVAMTAPETLVDFGNEGNLHLTNFGNRLTIAEITEEQQERISTYLDGLLEQYPEDRHMIEQRRILIRFDASPAAYMSRGPHGGDAAPRAAWRHPREPCPHSAPTGTANSLSPNAVV